MWEPEVRGPCLAVRSPEAQDRGAELEQPLLELELERGRDGGGSCVRAERGQTHLSMRGRLLQFRGTSDTLPSHCLRLQLYSPTSLFLLLLPCWPGVAVESGVTVESGVKVSVVSGMRRKTEDDGIGAGDGRNVARTTDEL